MLLKMASGETGGASIHRIDESLPLKPSLSTSMKQVKNFSVSCAKALAKPFSSKIFGLLLALLSVIFKKKNVIVL